MTRQDEKDAKKMLDELFFPFFMRVQNICIDGGTMEQVKAEVLQVRDRMQKYSQ